MARRSDQSITFSRAEARRLAVASQAFGPRPGKPGMGHLRKLAEKVHAFQIDSVNVLARAHYVPALARLGPYPMRSLDTLAYRTRELFEYWGHAASLLPISLFPLLRYRMPSEETLQYMRSERGTATAKAYAEVAERGPISAGELTDPGQRSSKWWGWGHGKQALEFLYDAGLVAIAGRRGFERLYDLAERVIPRAALDASPPPREEAMKQLIYLGARACGVGTVGEIAGYLMVDGWRDRWVQRRWLDSPKGQRRRPSRPMTRQLVAELVEEGRLLPASVEGWQEPAYVVPGARVPRRPVEARGFVSPFDSLMWDRARVERLFGMKYVLEIYVPEAKRAWGYYVYPFILGDMLVARCDLKADRQRKVLIVQSAFLEPGQDEKRVVAEMAGELRLMRSWLELDRIEVADRGDLARKLRRAV
jgi:uncharacterized protein